MKIILNIFTVVLTIFSLCIYCILAFGCVNRYIFIGLIVFIPIMILLRVRLLWCNKEIKTAIAVMSIIGILIVFAVIMACVITYICIKDGTTTITNAKEYRRLLNMESERLTYYFPNKIPKEAIDVQYSYQPQFLQGGMEMKLEFKTDVSEIDTYIDKYKDDYIKIIKTSDYMPSELNSLGIYSYGFDLNKNREDVTIYLIKSNPGNHGELAFIAVNDEHTEILFQAEQW